MKTPGRLDDLSTREWLREALEVSPDAFALHHAVRDESGCFNDLETSSRPELEAFATRVLDTIGDSAAVLDAQLRLRVANGAFLRLFGLSAQGAVGRTLFELGLGSGNEALLREYLERAGGDPHEALRLDHLCPKTGRHEFIHDAWGIGNTALRLFVTRDTGVPTRNQEPIDLRAERLERRSESDVRILAYQDKLRRLTFDAAVAAEQERRRVAIELHDRIGQALAVARLKLDALAASVPETVRGAIKEITTLVDQSAEDTRALCFELSPPVLYDLGLGPALAWLAEDLQRRYRFTVALEDASSGLRLPDVTASVLFRTARELLMNALKHARTAGARVRLQVVDRVLQLEVSDEGAGFDPHPAEHSIGGGFGIFSVREQLARIGALLDVQSAPGKGTRVLVSAPLGDQASAEKSSPATRWDLRSSPGNSVSR